MLTLRNQLDFPDTTSHSAKWLRLEYYSSDLHNKQGIYVQSKSYWALYLVALIVSERSINSILSSFFVNQSL